MTAPRGGEGAPASGWERLAQAVADVLPPADVDGVWVFAPVRREDKEWGTAVVSRVDGGRRRIYTAGYVLTLKGRERGKFESTIIEVGSGPMEALARVLQDAQRRTDDEHPPFSVSPDAWFSSAGARVDGQPR